MVEFPMTVRTQQKKIPGVIDLGKSGVGGEVRDLPYMTHLNRFGISTSLTYFPSPIKHASGMSANVVAVHFRFCFSAHLAQVEYATWPTPDSPCVPIRTMFGQFATINTIMRNCLFSQQAPVSVKLVGTGPVTKLRPAYLRGLFAYDRKDRLATFFAIIWRCIIGGSGTERPGLRTTRCGCLDRTLSATKLLFSHFLYPKSLRCNHEDRFIATLAVIGRCIISIAYCWRFRHTSIITRHAHEGKQWGQIGPTKC